MMFAAVVGHCSSRATPSLRYAPPRQSMEIVRGETIYRNRNAVQSNPATSPSWQRLLHLSSIRPVALPFILRAKTLISST